MLIFGKIVASLRKREEFSAIGDEGKCKELIEKYITKLKVSLDILIHLKADCV
jgi:hypothetical protein